MQREPIYEQQNDCDDIKRELVKQLQKKGKQSVSKNHNDLNRQSLNTLRIDFLKYLGKIYSGDTRKEGVSACHKLIQENCDSSAGLRVILGAL
mmetsp:Transcript_43223/g.41575  ORF Transcript_43223/g.41575 Transcript_43223/m.41575 type:complete len:93 (-) Transcript_43223:2174-2452(-)